MSFRANVQYLKYVLVHKVFVFWAGLYIMPRGLWAKVRFLCRLIVHDYSKFYPGEWTAYRDWFNDRPESQPAKREAKKAFDTAWLKHIHRNDHHWQHWILVRDATSIHDGKQVVTPPVPDLAIREMVADWAGAGRAQHGHWDLLPWYKENQDNIHLSETTLARVRMRVREIARALPSTEASDTDG